MKLPAVHMCTITSSGEVQTEKDFNSAFLELVEKGIASADLDTGINLRIPTSDAIVLARDPKVGFPIACALCYLLEKRAQIEGMSERDVQAYKIAKREALSKMIWRFVSFDGKESSKWGAN